MHFKCCLNTGLISHNIDGVNHEQADAAGLFIQTICKNQLIAN